MKKAGYIKQYRRNPAERMQQEEDGMQKRRNYVTIGEFLKQMKEKCDVCEIGRRRKRKLQKYLKILRDSLEKELI